MNHIILHVIPIQPWKSLSGDMAHFKKVTTTPPSPNLVNAVIMGRKTWDSIPPRFRPLDNRLNIVLTRQGVQGGVPEGVLVASSLEEAMQTLERKSDVGYAFIIGGGEIYKQSVSSGLVDRVIYTNVKNLPEDTKLDAYFPELCEEEWDCIPYAEKKENVGEDQHVDKKTKLEAVEYEDEKSGLKYEFLEYVRRTPRGRRTVTPSVEEGGIAEGADVNPEEMQYLEICREIIENGVKRGDRTGTGTLSKFGVQMRYSLRDDTLPLLTTKRTFWRGVAEELLWFVKVSLFLCLIHMNNFASTFAKYCHHNHPSQGFHKCQ